MNTERQKGMLAWFVYNPVAANLLMALILVVGVTTAINIRTEAFPASDPTLVTIEVGFLGGSPEVVEEGVAEKIEDALQGVAGIDEISSTVTSNSATIRVQALDGYPIDRLKDDVKIRVDSIHTFSDQVQNIVVSQQQEVSEVISVQVYGDTEHAVLKDVAKRVRQSLMDLPKVNKVEFQGMRDDEITIEVDEEKLRAYGLSFTEVADAIRGSSLNISAGELRSSSGVVSLQARQQRYSGTEFNDIVIRGALGGGLVQLTDIASIRDAYTDVVVLSEFEGMSAINLSVQLIGKDSITQASDAVNLEIEKLKEATWLPADVQIMTWKDDAQNIRNSLSILSMNGLIGMSLVLLVLALFLNARVAFYVAVGIPISIAGAFAVMGPNYLNYSLNELSIFAFILVLGIVVDDAIVIGESIHSHKKRNGNSLETTIRGAKEVATPATFGVLTTVAAFYPLTLISGVGGSFSMIATVVILCLLFSLVESKLILPSHLARVDLDKSDKSSNRFSQSLEKLQGLIDQKLSSFIRNHYKHLVALTIKHRYQSLAIFVGFFILTIGLVLGGQIRAVIMTDWQSRIVVADIITYPGTPAEETHDMARRVADNLSRVNGTLREDYQLETDPIEVSYTYSDSDQSAQVTGQLAPSNQRPFSSALVLEYWREASTHITGAQQLVFFAGPNFGEDLLIELSATEDAVAEQAARDLASEIAAYQGVTDIISNLENRQPELSISLKPEARTLGLTENEVMQQIRSAIFGSEAQRVQRGAEELRVNVRYPKQNRRTINDLEQIRIQTDSGGTVPLDHIVFMDYATSQIAINRKNGKRIYSIQAKLDKDITSSTEITSNLQSAVFPELLKRYPGLSIDVGGESEVETEAVAQLASGFVLGLIMIYALLAIPLKSYVKPVVIMLCIPFGVIGAIWGHFIMGVPFNILSFFGILALSGVVVNDSLVFVNRYNHLREEGHPYPVAVVQAGMQRFKAILLTSITTFVGLFPLLLESAEQAQMLIPMAISLAFGILFATVITLFIVPVLLGIYEDISELITRKIRGIRTNLTPDMS